jgi:hypothetical protein
MSGRGSGTSSRGRGEKEPLLFSHLPRLTPIMHHGIHIMQVRRSAEEGEEAVAHVMSRRPMK